MRIKALTFRHTIRTLAAPTQVDLQALLHVIVQIVVSLAGITVMEISAPSMEASIQVGDDFRDRFEPVPTTGEVPHRPPLLEHRLLRREHIQVHTRTVPTAVIPERVA